MVLRSIVITCALGLAVIHAILVPEHLEEKFYIGVLFAISTVLLLAAVVALVLPPWRKAGAWLASLVSAGMFVGYVLSRTTGLPHGYHEAWVDPLGLLSLALEAVLLAAMLPRTGFRGSVASAPGGR